VLYIYQQKRNLSPLHHHKTLKRGCERDEYTTGNVPVVLQKIDRGQNKSGSESHSFFLFFWWAFCALPSWVDDDGPTQSTSYALKNRGDIHTQQSESTSVSALDDFKLYIIHSSLYFYLKERSIRPHIRNMRSRIGSSTLLFFLQNFPILSLPHWWWWWRLLDLVSLFISP